MVCSLAASEGSAGTLRPCRQSRVHGAGGGDAGARLREGLETCAVEEDVRGELLECLAEMEVEGSDLQQQNLSLRTQFRKLQPRPAGGGDAEGESEWLDHEKGDTEEAEAEIASLGAENRSLRTQLAKILSQSTEGAAVVVGDGDVSVTGGGEHAREMRNILRKNLAKVRLCLSRVDKVAKLHAEGQVRDKVVVQLRADLARSLAKSSEVERLLLESDIRERRMKQEIAPLQSELGRLEDANRSLQRTRRQAKMFAPDATASPSKARGGDLIRTLERELHSQMSNPKVGASLQALREELESFSHAAVSAQVPTLQLLVWKLLVRFWRGNLGRSDRLHASEHSGRAAVHPSRLDSRTARGGTSASPTRARSSPVRTRAAP
ncbi:hypothetical protein T484DRAFT_1943095 [Baffinella frigidus]|nr:hypothetical protein T484DRAFT_1943095 [Cryptophyta sp. CCMP2293]